CHQRLRRTPRPRRRGLLRRDGRTRQRRRRRPHPRPPRTGPSAAGHLRGPAGVLRPGPGARGADRGHRTVARSRHRPRSPGRAAHGLDSGQRPGRFRDVRRHPRRALLLRPLLCRGRSSARNEGDHRPPRQRLHRRGRRRHHLGRPIPSREVRRRRSPSAAQLARFLRLGRTQLLTEPTDQHCPKPRGTPCRKVTMTDTTNKRVLLPAVDVADGKAVRLVQGEAGTETDYGSPIDAAQDVENRGAEWIHLVDLDAACGRGSNADRLNQVVKAVGIKVELSGGIRDTESLERALDTGAERVNLGTAALENPEWTAEMISRFGDQVAIGLDVRGTTLAARGWTQDGGDLYEVLETLEAAGCARYVVTDVRKDRKSVV